MVEEFDIGAKKAFNRLHAFAALIFWPVVCFFLSRIPVLAMLVLENWGLVIGIAIGVVRLFVILDKYSWQIATLNELNEVKNLVRSIRGGAVSNPASQNVVEKTQPSKKPANFLAKIFASKWVYFSGAVAMVLVLPFVTILYGYGFKYVFKNLFCFFKVILPLLCSIAMIVLFFVKSSDIKVVKILNIAKIVLPFLALLSFVVIAPITRIKWYFGEYGLVNLFYGVCTVIGTFIGSSLDYGYDGKPFFRFFFNTHYRLSDVVFIFCVLLFYAGAVVSIVSWFKTRKNEA